MKFLDFPTSKSEIFLRIFPTVLSQKIMLATTILSLMLGSTIKPQPLVEYKFAFVIKTEVDLKSHYALPAKFTMPSDVLNSILRNVTTKLPQQFAMASNGKIKFTPTIIMSKRPMTSYNRGSSDGSPLNDALNEVFESSEVTEYDGVGVVFAKRDPNTGYLLPTYGFGWAGNFEGNFGFMTVGVDTPLKENEEIFWHEWFHTVDRYYKALGCPIPSNGIHDNPLYDYPMIQSTDGRGWSHWYTDYINGTVRKKGGGIESVGIGDFGLRQPPPRLAGARKEFRKRKFDLDPVASFPGWMNGIFNDVRPPAEAITESQPLLNFDTSRLEPAWQFSSWSKMGSLRKNTSGQKSYFLLSSEQKDVINITRKVGAKLGHSYLLSGWVYTDGIRILERGGTTRFSISVKQDSYPLCERQFASSTGKWVYFQLPFTIDNTRDFVHIQVALGGHGSSVIGRGAVADLALEELNWK